VTREVARRHHPISIGPARSPAERGVLRGATTDLVTVVHNYHFDSVGEKDILSRRKRL